MQGEYQVARGFSPAILTRGGTTVYVAGQTTNVDGQGKDISYNVTAQAIQVRRTALYVSIHNPAWW